jgi:hypothetical protein
MSREILFKGKRIDNDEWVQGYLFDNGMVDSIPKRYFIGNLIIEEYKGTSDDDWDVVGTDFYEVYPNSVGQLTGFTDMNGERIFEGDILSYQVDELYP